MWELLSHRPGMFHHGEGQILVMMLKAVISYDLKMFQDIYSRIRGFFSLFNLLNS